MNARQRNARRRKVELSRLHNENECLGETLSNDVPPFSIGTLSEECINSGALPFLEEHGYY